DQDERDFRTDVAAAGSYGCLETVEISAGHARRQGCADASDRDHPISLARVNFPAPKQDPQINLSDKLTSGSDGYRGWRDGNGDCCEKAARLAGRKAGSYTDGPAKRQVWRWGRPLELTFLGLQIHSCEIITERIM